MEFFKLEVGQQISGNILVAEGAAKVWYRFSGIVDSFLYSEDNGEPVAANITLTEKFEDWKGERFSLRATVDSNKVCIDRKYKLKKPVRSVRESVKELFV